MTSWYRLEKEGVMEKLRTSASGLKSSEISSLQKKFGRNELKEAKRKSKFAILLGQFKDLMIVILIVAAVISFLSGETTDALVILAIIICNAWIGYMQENNAEESVRMLQKMTAQHALVLRDGNTKKIDANELVPGDVIVLEAGSVVPADARLLEISAFKTDEAALTGESHSIQKSTEVPEGDGELSPGDQLNMVFKGTVVSNGSAKAVVTTTGMRTEIGKIAGMLEIEEQKTPLQKRLAVFSKQLAVIVLVICVLVFAFGLWRGERPFLMFLTALSLAVAALPEALPAVVTIALSRGARRMVKLKALVRALPAVETLGSVTYICSDKTGTLTQNVMTVEQLEAAEGKEDILLHAMMLNNEVRYGHEGELLGDSTELALVRYAQEKGLTTENAEKRFPLEAKLPFDSERMRMSTLHSYGDKWLLLVKGAPARIGDVLHSRHADSLQTWLDRNREWASDGLRVLFFGYRILEEKPSELNEELEADLDFLGMVAMIDPPREEVIDAVQECKTAGIHTVMITGDQPLTAYAIAERLQMVQEDSKASLTGAELAKLGEEEFASQVNHISVYARVSPEQKLNIVKALQENGAFVAMTGDGVNDAPSLKQANIGVAMGITGTDVSKEASDMILLDDNFATIVKAVKEGRRIYDNIRKFVLYVLSCNLAEILTIFFAPFLGLVIPLLPIHILWINLVTDGLPGLALAAEPAEKDIMKRPPRPPKENLFAQGLAWRILSGGALMATVALITQGIAARLGYNTQSQQTIVFMLLCFIQLGNALSVRSAHYSMFHKELFGNAGMWAAIGLTVGLQLCIVYIPALHPIFKTTALDWQAMELVLAATAAGILGVELIKWVVNKLSRKIK